MANQYRVKTGVKLYTQVLEQVKSMIAQGVYQKGDLLPSEKELIEMMGVSRITVRKALQILSEAGVIETRKGKGSFVAVDATATTDSITKKRKNEKRFSVFYLVRCASSFCSRNSSNMAGGKSGSL